MGWAGTVDCATEALFFRRDGAFADAARRESEKNARRARKHAFPPIPPFLRKGKDKGKGKAVAPKAAPRKVNKGKKRKAWLGAFTTPWYPYVLEEETSSKGGLLILKRRPPEEEAS